MFPRRRPMSDPAIDPYYDDPSSFYFTLDLRSHPQSPSSEDNDNPKVLGDGRTHDDVLDFSLTGKDKDAEETLRIRHHVRACHFKDLSTATLKRLLVKLLELQDRREEMQDAIAIYELPARDHTIATLEEVLEARGRWLKDDDEGGDGEKEKGGDEKGKEKS